MHPKTYRRAHIFAVLATIFNTIGLVSFLWILFTTNRFEDALNVYMVGFIGAAVCSLLSLIISKNRKAFINLGIATLFLLILAGFILMFRNLSVIR